MICKEILGSFAMNMKKRKPKSIFTNLSLEDQS